MARIFYINAKKLVQLEQQEIEAETEQEAIAEYLFLAKRGEIPVSDFSWYELDGGDLDVEDHGEANS